MLLVLLKEIRNHCFFVYMSHLFIF